MKRSLWALVLIGCSVTLPFAPENATRISPPEAYRVWFDEVVTCAALSKPFTAIEWYTVPSPMDVAGRQAFGAYSRGRIYLVEYAKRSRRFVKHEILHYLLDPRSGHPEPPFSVCERAS